MQSCIRKLYVSNFQLQQWNSSCNEDKNLWRPNHFYWAVNMLFKAVNLGILSQEPLGIDWLLGPPSPHHSGNKKVNEILIKKMLQKKTVLCICQITEW